LPRSYLEWKSQSWSPESGENGVCGVNYKEKERKGGNIGRLSSSLILRLLKITIR
jgi:hypothetical protein